MEQPKVETLSTVRVSKTKDLYKIVDCLNRTLKEKDVMFGLSLDQNDEEQVVFTIYKT